MQAHTREAIKRKALIPICNCFSISTDLLTGPKSGNALSPVSSVTGSRAPLATLHVQLILYKTFFPRKQTFLTRAPDIESGRLESYYEPSAYDSALHV